MQIAQVVPKTRTQKEAVFDYAIPPELLPMVKPGVLVEVPFHGRKLEGIIIKLKSKSQISNLKSITNVIDPVLAVDEVHIKLAEWMSEYYLTPFGQTLFENVVPTAKRTIKKLTGKNYRHTLIAGANRIGRSKKYLIVGDFPTRLKFYLAAIQKTLIRNKSSIILLPDLSLIPYFTKYIKNPIVILHAGMTKTQRWLAWDKIRRNDFKIVIGSQSALFAPVKNLGLIIIDQEENETYKNDRSPRYHAVTVAEELSHLSTAHLVIGSITPRIETYHQATQSKYRLIKKQPTAKNITIVDMNSEKYVISNTLEEKIEISLQNKKRTLLVLNRKGEGTKFSCTDCGWIALCEKCGLPLIPQKSVNVCYRCEKSFDASLSCPKCQSIHLKPTGLGTARLKKFLADLFPKAKIIQVEKEIDGRQISYGWDIAIATSHGLKFNWPKISLVGIVDADQGLNFPDFNSPQKTFQILYKFLKIGERGIIQTHLPENYVIKTLAQLNYEKFFLEELTQRRKYGFPPFTRLLRLLFKDANEEKVKLETQRVYKQILTLTTDNRLLITLSAPHAAFIERERGKFRWQIVLRIVNLKLKIPQDLKNLLRSLNKGWIVDIDPVNLL